MKDNNKNIHTIEEKLVPREKKEKLLTQRSHVFWLTGLSGSGKSTLAIEMDKMLYEDGYLALVIDGDNTRSRINRNLGFSDEDRRENTRRVAEISRLFLNSGIICINSFITPKHNMQKLVREIIPAEDLSIIYIKASVEACEKRDVKGLYKKARKGELKNFTGIDEPYEEPHEPALVINTDILSKEESVRILKEFIVKKTENK